MLSVNNTVPLATIAEHAHKPVVKAIPTIAHLVGRGVSLLVAAPGALPEHIEAVRAVFAHFSLPIVIDGRDDRVASNVAGSALALFAALCDTFVSANAARAATLDRATLDAMMAETAGPVAALVKAGYSWSDIVRATATPGGMTHAALDVLTSRFPQIADDMVEATFARQAAIQNRQEAHMTLISPTTIPLIGLLVSHTRPQFRNLPCRPREALDLRVTPQEIAKCPSPKHQQRHQHRRRVIHFCNH